MKFIKRMFELLKCIRSIQDEHICPNCKQVYNEKWFNNRNNESPLCIFCINFLPMRDTYYSIIRNIDWWFLKFGDNSKEEFYKEFLFNLKKWADRFHVFPTEQDLKTMEELLDI